MPILGPERLLLHSQKLLNKVEKSILRSAHITKKRLIAKENVGSTIKDINDISEKEQECLNSTKNLNEVINYLMPYAKSVTPPSQKNN